MTSDKGDSQEYDATWSPDGNEIIFARDLGQEKADRWELLRVNLQTRKATPVPGSKGLFSPRWSPDGHSLAAITEDLHTIRLFDFRTQVWAIWFTTHDGTVGWPMWSPDSRAIAFLIDEGKGATLAWWRIGPGKQPATKIIELPEENILDSWSSLEADGSSYFTRDLTTTDIYAIHVSEK